MSGKYYSNDLKQEIVNKIKSEGITATEGASRYGVGVKSIYRWLANGVGGVSSQILETNKLKRENRQLKEIIGQLTFDKKKGEKN
jgi:transposase-like protein